MLGIHDPSIYLGYLLAVLSLAACVWYGAKNWNNGSETDVAEWKKDLDWEEKDEQINQQL